MVSAPPVPPLSEAACNGAAVQMTTATIKRIGMNITTLLSARAHAHGFDYVAHIARRIPQRPHGLCFPEAVHRAHFQPVQTRLQSHVRVPLAEGVFDQVFE